MFNVLKRIFGSKGNCSFVSDSNSWSVIFPFAQVVQSVTKASQGKAMAQNIHPLIAATLAEIDELRQIRLQINDAGADIKLAVKLADNQDALVYYQHFNTDCDGVAEVEFLFPRTPKSSANLKEYLLPQDLVQQIAANDDREGDTAVQLYIAVYQKDSKSIPSIEHIAHDIEAFRHELQKFDPLKNTFEPIGVSAIDFSAKTLILIHGTFSNTCHSYRDIMSAESDWLKHLIDSGIYGQILGFDHPTVIADARTNVDMLYRMLGNRSFTAPTDFIGTSQGGLLCQFIANDRRSATPFSTYGVGKVALVNSANGVGYLTTAEGIARFFNVLRWVAAIDNLKIEADISRIANFSADTLIQLPGLDLMKPGSARLLEILNNVPAGTNTRYYPIVSDFDPESAHKKLKIRIAKWLDSFIRRILGDKNDWVVGTKEQYRVPKDYCAIVGYNPDNYTSRMVSVIHSKALAIKSVRDDLEDFLR